MFQMPIINHQKSLVVQMAVVVDAAVHAAVHALALVEELALAVVKDRIIKQ